MIKDADPIFAGAENREQWEQLLFALGHRKKPTLAILTADTDRTRQAVYEKLIRNLSQYQFHDLHLEGRRVVSLCRAFEEHLPQAVSTSRAATYIVNVFGLENSIFFIDNKGKPEQSDLIAELNLERENLFQNFSFIIILWLDVSVTKKLRSEAKDLWDWITYHFEFRGGDEHITKFEKDADQPLPLETYPLEKMAHIRDLQAKYETLESSDASGERVIRDKDDPSEASGKRISGVERL